MKSTMPTKTLLQGQPYTPSFLMKPPKVRYTVERLNGHYGLRKEPLSDGTKTEPDPHASAELWERA